MINTGKFSACTCLNRGVPSKLCDGLLSFEEKGKKVKITTKAGEEAKALVVDGCISQDGNRRCDGIFLFRRNNRHWMILVELKGSHIDDAFTQLAYMQKRMEYKELKDIFMEGERGKLHEIAFIVSNQMIPTAQKVKLEQQHGIRVKSILHSKATISPPDVRDYL